MYEPKVTAKPGQLSRVVVDVKFVLHSARSAGTPAVARICCFMSERQEVRVQDRGFRFRKSRERKRYMKWYD